MDIFRTSYKGHHTHAYIPIYINIYFLTSKAVYKIISN